MLSVGPHYFHRSFPLSKFFAFNTAMHKPELFRLVVNNFEFINLVIHDSSFENRNELVERLATIKRGGLSDIYRIVFWSDF